MRANPGTNPVVDLGVFPTDQQRETASCGKDAIHRTKNDPLLVGHRLTLPASLAARAIASQVDHLYSAFVTLGSGRTSISSGPLKAAPMRML